MTQELGSAKLRVAPERIGEGSWINGDLDLSGLADFRLPAKLRVEGDLRRRASQLTGLPKNLRVGGDLNLTDSWVKELAKGLHVGLVIER